MRAWSLGYIEELLDMAAGAGYIEEPLDMAAGAGYIRCRIH